MIKKLFLIGFLAFSFSLTVQAAPNPFDIEFPIAELGNCTSIDECKTYCDDSANIDQCIRWAEDNGFAPEQPEQSAPRDIKGPGGCDSRGSCDNYCHNPDNNQECLDFAVREGFMTQAEADRILDLQRRQEEFHQRALDRVPDRPRVDDRRDDEPEIDEAKVLKLLEEIDGPGGCNTFDQCDEYCSNDDHGEECFAFAVEHGLMAPEDAERFKRMMELEGPGGCRGEECRDFCDAPGHERECLEFAHDNGFIPDEEYEQVKKFVEILEVGGPGGCKDQRSCDSFCQNPANQEECFSFAKEHGLISPEELQLIEEVQGFERELRRREEDQIRRGPDFKREDFREDEFGNFTREGDFGEFRDDFNDFDREFDDFGDFREFDELRPDLNDFGGHDGFEQFREDEFRYDEFTDSLNESFRDEYNDDRVDEQFNREIDRPFQNEIDGQFNEGIDREYNDQYNGEYQDQSQYDSVAPEYQPPSNFQQTDGYQVPEIHDFPSIQEFEIPNDVGNYDSRDFPAPTDYTKPAPSPPVYQDETNLGDLTGTILGPFLRLLIR